LAVGIKQLAKILSLTNKIIVLAATIANCRLPIAN